MNGAERITRRILEEANARATAICEEAENKAAATVAEAEKVAARTREQIAERAAREALEQKRRIKGMAELEERKKILATKRDLLERAFEQALEKLAGLDEVSYQSLLKRMLLTVVETGDETVVLSMQDRARLGREFWDTVNRDLSAAGKKGKLVLAPETHDLAGGFILQSAGLVVNCSFESLLGLEREELEPEVAAILFKEPFSEGKESR